MGAPVGEPLDVFAKHNFIIEIDGIKRAGFKSCSQLEVEVTEIAYHEGGRSIPHKSPGKQKFTNITLERGVTTDMDLYTWLEETAKMATGRGLKGNGPKRNFDLVLLDRDGSERRRYSIFQAWPTKFSAGDFDGESETDPLIETMELSIDYWEISKN